MKLKFSLIGSCYSAYMFKEKILGSLANGNIELVYQHQHDSLISIMTEPVSVDLKGVRSDFQWDFDHFADSIFAKDIFQKMEYYQPDYLVFDTYAEGECPLIKINDQTYLTNNYYISSSSLAEKFKKYEILQPSSAERWQLFEKYAVAFFEKLKKIFPDIKIILVRSRGAEEISENSGSRKFASADLISKKNLIREKCDEFILQHIDGIRELCMSDTYNLASPETNEQYGYSISANHFSVQYYREEYSKLQRIVIADLLGQKEETNYFNQAVCILAQDDFSLLLLMAKIYKDFFKVYIHIPVNAVETFFSQEQISRLNNIPNVTVLVKYRIEWGSYNELLALQELSDMAFRNQNIKYVHYISNYDMPIRPINKIYEFYEKKAGGRSFLNCHANGDRKQMRAMADTTYGYYYYLYNENENDPAVKEQINASIESQKRMGISRNALGEFTDLYKGVIWSSLSREAYLYCRDYAETHPEYVNDIKFTRLRTEFFFHTILFNSDRLREKIVSGIRGGKHGWFWDEKRRDYKTLTFESYQVLKQDEQYLFARKVTSQDRKLIELILKDIKSPYKYKLE